MSQLEGILKVVVIFFNLNFKLLVVYTQAQPVEIEQEKLMWCVVRAKCKIYFTLTTERLLAAKHLKFIGSHLALCLFGLFLVVLFSFLICKALFDSHF